jgi:hypothetical protein
MLEMPAVQLFLAISKIANAIFRALFASSCEWIVALSTAARRALSHRRVNTSLSGKLFF